MNQIEIQKRILIIDDDLSFQMLVRKKLEKIISHAITKACSSIKEAKDFIKSESLPLDLVVLDHHLPDGKGIDLLKEGFFGDAVVLAVSSDKDPQIPGSAVGVGAAFFLSKANISDPLFEPLVRGLTDRVKLNRELGALKIQVAVIDSIKTLVSTLRHEINNPLGGVLGAAYLLKNYNQPTDEQKKAAEIVEKSAHRIKHVLDQLTTAVSLDKVNKGGQEVYHVPGDKEWKTSKDS